MLTVTIDQSHAIRGCIRSWYTGRGRWKYAYWLRRPVSPQPPRVFRISFYWTTFHHYLGAWNRLRQLVLPGKPDSCANVTTCCLAGSSLVNIHLKALLSSVGFRKRMTSLSPRGSLYDSCKLRFDRPLWFVLWSDVCFEVLSCFFDHPSIDSTKKMPLHLFGKDVLMFRLDQAS